MTDFTQRTELLKLAIEQGKYPRFLYKYRADSDTTLSILENCSMWFSSPESFNDPFDCNLSEVSSHTQEEANLFLEHILAGRPDREQLLSRGTSVEVAEQSLISSKKAVLSRTGVLCLSREFDNILMWSHYTNCHKGLVMELDVLADLEFFVSPIQVKYTESYEPTNYFVDQHAAITRIISTKSECWSYENEVRIIKSGITGAVQFNPKALRRVIFGCKSEPDFISRVRSGCAARLQHVSFNQLKISYGKFGLELSELAT